MTTFRFRMAGNQAGEAAQVKLLKLLRGAECVDLTDDGWATYRVPVVAPKAPRRPNGFAAFCRPRIGGAS